MATRQNLAKCTMFRKHKKTVSKQIGNRVFDTSIFPILVDFAFEFWHKLLTLYGE